MWHLRLNLNSHTSDSHPSENHEKMGEHLEYPMGLNRGKERHNAEALPNHKDL